MTKLIRIFLLIFSLGLIFSQTGKAIPTDSLKTDNSYVQVRKSNKLEDYKNNRDFKYDEEVQTSNNLWSKIWSWIFDKINKFFSNKGIIPWIRNIIFFLIFGFIIFKLFNMSFQTIFLKRRKNGDSLLDYETYDEDILRLDLDKIINEAINQKDYRKAIRYLYLKLLRVLNEREIIEWENNKTNRDYRDEIKNTKYANPFFHLTFVYEHIWYGDFAVNEAKFSTTEEEFDNLFKSIIKRA